MKNALLALLVIVAAAPAFAGPSEDEARQEEKKFFDFSGSGGRQNSTQQNDNKRCVSPPDPIELKKMSIQEQQLVYATYKYIVVRKITDETKCTCENVFPSFNETMIEFKKLYGNESLPVSYNSALGKRITKYINDISSPYSKVRMLCAKNKVK
ncbi:hypothetical protein [Brucella intermedia]|uniref:hypothetical protein n=1 Tax=Brucella intermedia TaxID=94625 RepID=UPI00235E7E0B|nr:hypothetical protein [Brucella intermedia]